MSTKLYLTFAFLSILMIFAACKPTEKNYSAAYEAARSKRESDEAKKRDLAKDLGIDFKELKSVDANTSRFEGDVPDSLGGGTLNLPLIATNISRADNVKKFSAAIAKFKMKANADGLAEDLRGEGYPYSRAIFSGDTYFVIIEENDNPLAMTPTIRRFQTALKNFPYVGLGEMTIIRRLNK